MQLPENLSRADLIKLMRDERYADPAHPQYADFRETVTEGFRRLYGPGPALRDASGRSTDPDAA